MSHQVRNPLTSVLFLISELANEIDMDLEISEKFILPINSILEIIL